MKVSEATPRGPWQVAATFSQSLRTPKEQLQWLLQHVEVLAFTCTTVSSLAAVIHYISINVIRTVGEGHLCDPNDHACEQNFNLIVIT